MAQSSPGSGGKTFPEVVGEAVGWALLGVFGVAPAVLLVLAVWFPMFSVPIAGAVVAGWYWGWPAGAGIGVVSVAGWMVWRVRFPASFHRWVTSRWRWRSWWRRWTLYELRWGKVVMLNGLTKTLEGKLLRPGLTVRAMGAAADLLRVKMLDGQTVDDWANKSEALRHSLRAVGVRVRGDDEPRYTQLEVIHRDLLRDPVPLPPLTDHYADLSGIGVGLTELGMPFGLKLYGGHLLIAAKSNGGKSNVLRCVLAALGPMIRDGLVLIWCMDLKMGMEFSRAEPLFTRFVYKRDESAVQFLRDVVALVEARGERFRLLRRDKFVQPTRDDPFIIVILDEMASLVSYFPDKKLREEAEELIGRLTSVGRAPGVSVVGTVQDPSKDILAHRQLFSYRIGLKMDEPTQIPMVFGAGARERGAACDRISDATPGVGYYFDEDRSGFVRVRFYHVTSDDMDAIVARYAPGRGSARAVTASLPEDSAWLDDWGEDGDGGLGLGGGSWPAR